VNEKAVSIQSREHTIENRLEELFQSAYKASHSCETALIRVQDDLLRAIDDKKVCILILLDLSAAFDTVDHTILIKRLSSNYHIHGTALNWYISYLTGRDQTVVINGTKSAPRPLSFSVPQGSILGPELFIKYAAPVTEIIKKHNLNYHIYADDTQIYIFCDPSDIQSSIKRIEACVAEIRTWMSQNFLKFNDAKTEMILLGKKSQLEQITDPEIKIGEFKIKASKSVRNIGVQFDQYLNMEEHVRKTCKAATFNLRNIYRIRKFLTCDATVKLIHAFISSKIDYGNALLAGVPNKLIHKLQLIQNTAARIVVNASKYDHVTPILRKLHWLPVKQRVQYKVLVTTFKALNGLAPGYLTDLLKPYRPQRQLRSSSKMLLQSPKWNLKTYGHRAFSSMAPTWWNVLPEKIRLIDSLETFKNNLKTHLFTSAFQ
jgi:hypothetical protein